MYTDKFADIIKKHKNAYQSTIKMKPVNVRSSTYIDFSIENNDTGPKFKADDHVRISKNNFKKIQKRLHSKLV